MPATPTEPLAARLPGTWALVSRREVLASGGRRPDPALGEHPVTRTLAWRRVG